LPRGRDITSTENGRRELCDPNDILGVDYDTLSGQAAFFNTRVKVYKA